ncbi:MAG: sterol desaturase family protein [Bacteroidales bacterium]|nr:sterol desaturase family protein [Bacteroidales bacterium]MCF8345052.1 sterol desaturase family protein [Bacteroidales bacterium]MCF8352648.1 sterol desaturase family protein [Bacteroidales bacterium]MCF8375723.1 sterol desaturase family protein [Bacteroidales bacterium]MCF8400323.1 sterol desaturase family protein [Bacteroidales bacterium]
MDWYFIVLIIIATFFFMEFVAWFTHKYVMHGFLWSLHKDHHIRDGRRFEWNDLFAVFFAAISVILIFLGTRQGLDYRFWIGIGIFFYGMAYFLFHDVYVHKRVRIFNKLSNRYLRATVKAHLEHHTPHSHKNYGFLLAPLQYYLEEFRKSKRQNYAAEETV